MNVYEIIKDYLIKNGYDGLFCADYDCACLILDLQPCCEDMSRCKPGYKIQCPSGGVGYDWTMVDKK